MKKFLSVVAVLGLMFIVGCGGGDNFGSQASIEDGEITLAQYKAIKRGMTIKKVSEIVGFSASHPTTADNNFADWQGQFTSVVVCFNSSGKVDDDHVGNLPYKMGTVLGSNGPVGMWGDGVL